MINILFRDVLFNMVLFLVVQIVSMLPFLNPPTKQSDDPPPGVLAVYVAWPSGSPNDVDLWASAPDEPAPVGFSHTTGKYLSLLRDDRGNTGDPMPLNMEHLYSRGAPAGEYVVNLHCFSCAQDLPVEVAVEIRLNGIVLLATKATLFEHKQEITVIRFRIDAKGKVVAGSLNNIYKPLQGDGK